MDKRKVHESNCVIVDPDVQRAFEKIFELTVELHRILGTSNLGALPRLAAIQRIAKRGRLDPLDFDPATGITPAITEGGDGASRFGG